MSRQGTIALALFCLLVVGCQRARQVEAPPREPSAPEGERKRPAPDAEAAPPLNPYLAWDEDPHLPPPADVPIRFVTEESDRATWEKLPRYWNAPVLHSPEAAEALRALSPLAVLAALQQGDVVTIKVPRGLPDPRPFLPLANPPSLAKWQLGRDLFFDASYLRSDKSQSCAGCHAPSLNFRDQVRHNGYNTLPLANVVYNRRQFWDGRAEHLEEVVQRSLEDERESERTDGRSHVWGGVAKRLRDNAALRSRFVAVFGVPPTEDTVGRALATYLRTLLLGDSLFDRARAVQAQRGGKALEQADFAAALRDGEAAALAGKMADKAEVLGGVYRGYRLFFDIDEKRPFSCLSCHGGALFTDQGYHNLGVGFGWERKQLVGVLDVDVPSSPGRFGAAPLGEKSRRLIGAFRTPSLRVLSPKGPYFHTGEVTDLGKAIELHGKEGGLWNRYLDPLLLDSVEKPAIAGTRLETGLAKNQLEDMGLFLRALQGGAVDKAVASPLR